MRKTGWVLLGGVLVLVVFWVGLIVNFPGAALSRFIESKISALPSLEASLSPATLGWSGINFQTFRLSYKRPGGADPLLTLEDVSVALTWRLVSGLPVSGSLGDQGRLDFFVPWKAGETFAVSGAELPLEKIPAIAVFTPLRLRGRLTFSGSVAWPGMTGKRPRAFPAGSLIARGEELEVLQLEVLGIKLPTAKLESLDLEITTGDRIKLDRLEFRGDLQGSVTGTLRPRLSNFGQTSLQLKVAASFRQTWLSRLGALQAVAEGFLKGGRLEGNLRGTIAQPRFQAARGSS